MRVDKSGNSKDLIKLPNEGNLEIVDRTIKIRLGREISRSSLIESIKLISHIFFNEVNKGQYYLKLAENAISKGGYWADLFESKKLNYQTAMNEIDQMANEIKETPWLGLTGQKKMLIESQVRKFPIMQKAVEINPGRVENLVALSQLLDQLSKEDEAALYQIGDSSALLPFLEGDPADTKNIIDSLREEIQSFKKREIRKESPVAMKAIVLQAELHQAIREGKESAKDAPFGFSSNKVFALYKQNEKEIVAFFKEGVKDNEATAKMEKLVWDIAVLMGLEEYFAPTKEETLHNMRGSAQVAIKGRVLHEVIGTEMFHATRQEIANGVLVSVVFGMFDAHRGNIIVTNEGKIKFIDNARSLPNGNGFLDLGKQRYIFSYRSALLDLPETAEALTREEIESLKRAVAALKLRQETLKDFLNSPQTQKTIKDFPTGWFDSGAVYDAMKARVENLDRFLQSGDVKTAQDLVVLTYPEYKFAYGAHLFYLLLFDPITYQVGQLHSSIGFYSMKEVLENLEKAGVDIKIVKQWCEDSTVSLEELKGKIVANKQTLYCIPADPNEYIKLEEELMKNATVDYKDIPKKLCEGFMRNRNLKAMLEEPGVHYMDRSGDAITLFLELGGGVLFKEQDHFNIVHSAPSGYVIEPLNLKIGSGKIKVGEREMPIKGFLNVIDK